MKNLLWLILLIGVNACKTAPITIYTLKAPKEDIMLKSGKLAIIDRTHKDRLQIRHFENGRYIADLNNLEGWLPQEVKTGLADFFDQTGYFEPKLLMGKGAPSGNRITTMNKEVVKQICTRESVDGVLAIERIRGDWDTDGSVTYSPTIDRNFGSYQVPLFDGSQTARLFVYFRLYSCKLQQIIHEFESENQSIKTARGDTPEQMMSGLKPTGLHLALVAQKCAESYGKLISPYFSPEKRKLYTVGDSLSKAFDLAEAERWDEAMDFWILLTESNNTKIRAKAAYNMAVACEASGDIKLCREWLAFSYKNHKMNSVVKYREFIDRMYGE